MVGLLLGVGLKRNTQSCSKGLTFSLNKSESKSDGYGVFKDEKVGVRPVIGMVIEPSPKKPFLLKYGL
jgi:hypothetical protein